MRRGRELNLIESKTNVRIPHEKETCEKEKCEKEKCEKYVKCENTA